MNKTLWKEFGRTLFHPYDTFEEMRFKKTGSAAIAGIFVFLLFLMTLLERKFTAFRFNAYSEESTNTLLIFLSTSLLIGIAVVVNWGISTLWDGKANLRMIWIVFGYALAPYIFGIALKIVASQFLTLEEAAFLNSISAVALLWTGALLWFGMLQTQEYTIGKTLLCLVATVLGILLVIALGFLLILLFSQLFSFIGSLVNEGVMRLE